MLRYALKRRVLILQGSLSLDIFFTLINEIYSELGESGCLFDIDQNDAENCAAPQKRYIFAIDLLANPRCSVVSCFA